MFVLYGIPNCDTVKKARQWLIDHKVDYLFHDYKKQGITKKALQNWANQVGWEVLINKKGTTWKKLDPVIQNKVIDVQTAIEVLLNNQSAIRRPIITSKEKIITLGFDSNEYTKWLLPK